MKKVIYIIALMICTLGLSAQDNSFPDKVDNVKEKLDPASIVGIQYYDADVLMKKMKVKKPDQKLEVSNLIQIYNSSLKKLEAENKSVLSKFGTDLVDILKTKDWKGIFGSGVNYKKKIEAIRDESATHLAIFEKDLFEISKKRQKKKYLKYKSQLAKALEESTELGDVFSTLGL